LDESDKEEKVVRPRKETMKKDDELAIEWHELYNYSS
jgi:hypothetical protein